MSSRSVFYSVLVCTLFLSALVGIAADVVAQESEPPPPQVRFENVRVFDGTSDSLTSPTSVLVENNLIKSIGSSLGAGPQAVRIDGGGRTLMPGLIDGHTHFALTLPGGLAVAEDSHWQYLGAMATYAAREHLYMGFTTAREIGGGAVGPGFKKAIDEGFIEGPRIYPSGAYVTQTSGHGDFVTYGQLNQEENNLFRLGFFINADGADAVTAAVRKNLSLGASQIKIMVSGGVFLGERPAALLAVHERGDTGRRSGCGGLGHLYRRAHL